MKRMLITAIIYSLMPVLLSAAPLEFVAEVEGVSEVDGETVLTVRLTPAATLEVRVTELTELKDDTGLPITAEDLETGQTVKVEAIFTDQGVLALEIEVLGDDVEFEFRGMIEDVGDDSITLLGLVILVPETADIKDEFGNPLTLEELMAGDLVKVEGMTDGDDLVANDIQKLSEESFARISFLGVIQGFPADNQLMVRIDGGVQVLVEITEDTDIRGGPLTEGALIRVIGLINPDLFVTALKIRVVSALFELSPPRLRLDPEESRAVDVILQQSLDEDLTLQLVSADPDVAQASPAELTIPAGELTASFEVTAGSADGETMIIIMVNSDGVGMGLSAELQVEVGEDDEADGELTIMWTPRVIKAAPQGVREVSIFVRPGLAPTDLPISLSLLEGPPNLVSFPEEVVIPAGQHRVFFQIEIQVQPGQAVIRAELPEELGGATDDLVVELAPGQLRTRLHWAPSRVTASTGSDLQVELRLERPAPFPLTVSVERLNGDAAVVAAFPAEIFFDEGEDTVVVEFSTTETTGRVTYRARGPSELGNAHADLRITVM